MKYNKLVRDGIPDKIKRNNKTPKTHISDEKEFAEKLKDKLDEEVEEFIKDENVEELADILEVIYAQSELKGTSKENLERIRQNKLKLVGEFKNRIILDEVK